ncbi:MAG TPA: hypothetical protein VFO38_01790 [Candidatus Saccharimonadales bacterium]|nr:hypothetical protein [Candidatus Saccharimonadales bacterium]
MSITAERSPFAHYEHHRRFETSENHKGSLRKRGALAVRNFFKSLKEGAKEAFGVQPNRVTPAQQLREHVAQVRQKHENVNIPTQRGGSHERIQPEQVNPRPAQEKAFDQQKGWLYDNVNYGLKQDAIYRRPHEDVRWLDDEPHITGTVEASETIHYDNTPNSPYRATSGEAGRISYGRHDSGETRHSGHGRHSREDQNVIGSETWVHQTEFANTQRERQEAAPHERGLIDSGEWESYAETPIAPAYSKQENSIGSPEWFREQERQERIKQTGGYDRPGASSDEYNPNNNSEGVIGSNAWYREQPAEPPTKMYERSEKPSDYSEQHNKEQEAWERDNWRFIQGINPNTKLPYEDDSHHYNRAA